MLLVGAGDVERCPAVSNVASEAAANEFGEFRRTLDGREMTGEEWGDDLMKCFGMLMDGRARPTGVQQRGTEAAMLLVLNSHHDLVNFTLPEYPDGLEAG